MSLPHIAPSHVRARRILALMIALTAASAVACTTAAVDVQVCSVNCQDLQTKCVSKCNNEACRTQCKTDFDNCLLSCGPNSSAFFEAGTASFTDGSTTADAGVALPVDGSSTVSLDPESGAPSDIR